MVPSHFSLATVGVQTVDWSGAQIAAADAKRKSQRIVPAPEIFVKEIYLQALNTSSRQCAHITMYHAILLPVTTKPRTDLF